MRISSLSSGLHSHLNIRRFPLLLDFSGFDVVIFPTRCMTAHNVVCNHQISSHVA